jgi:hypothetical protein
MNNLVGRGEVGKKISSHIKAGGCAVSYQKTVSKNL